MIHRLIVLLAFGLLSAGCFSEVDDRTTDGGSLDAGGADGGSGDAGPEDGGGTDGGITDGGATDGGGSDGGSTACNTLDLRACRQRADCAADICFACSCTPSFEGCRLARDPAFVCPEYGCPMPMCCQSAAECSNMGASCDPPGTPFPCGTCFSDPGNCRADVDCGTGEICEPMDCHCNGESACEPGCGSDADCEVGESCSGGAHPRCQAAACSATTPCPPDFDCQRQLCQRRSCSSDLDCDRFCVSGSCFGGLGACVIPPP